MSIKIPYLSKEQIKGLLTEQDYQEAYRLFYDDTGDPAELGDHAKASVPLKEDTDDTTGK